MMDYVLVGGTGVKVGTSGRLRLYHGTDATSASQIVEYGLDVERARATGGHGEFWTTIDIDAARVFAVSNLHGPPSLVQFDLPPTVVDECLMADPKAAFIHFSGAWFEFQPSSFSLISGAMSNVATIALTIEFDE